MGIFILFLLFVLGGLISIGTGVALKKAGPKGGGAAAIVVGLAVLFFGMFNSVPVKSVGVATSFGHVEGDLTPGPHLNAPWTSVTILPETIQTTTFNGKDCLQVRIGGQQTACLDATIQWQVKDSAAPKLFNDYDISGQSVLGNIKTAVVIREFEQVVNQTLGDYNPIQDVALNSGAGNSQFSTFGPLVQHTMRQDIGTQINVIRVIMPILHYDASTQNRLNTIQAQYAEAAIAQEQIVVNQEQAKANAAIGSPTPQQLVQECYSILQQAMKSNYKGLPPTLSCGSGSAGVVVGA